MRTRLSFVFGLLLLSQSAIAALEVANREDLRKALGLRNYGKSQSLAEIKIAVLDNGFMGFAKDKGMLPESAELIEGPVNGQLPTAHGLGMAQIAWAITGQNPQGPKFYLINSNGFSNFKAAIAFVIEKKIDIVLYAQNWTLGGNFDGKGFIDAEVSRATDAGVLWINNAGNHGGLVYNQGVLTHLDRGKDLEFENQLDDNPVTVVLNWNDFADSEEIATDKDLDLFVYDDKDNLIGSSELTQGEPSEAEKESKDSAAPEKRHSKYAREQVVLRQLARGKYRIRIQAASKNFGKKDWLRMHLINDKPGSLILKTRTEGYEIFPPADHPKVITVGESSPTSAVGPTVDGRKKPDVVLSDATIYFTNGNRVSGSSNAAAIFSGIAALLKSAYRDQGREFGWNEVKRILMSISQNTSVQGLRSILPKMVPYSVRQILPTGARVMQNIATGRFVVLSPTPALTLPLFASSGLKLQNEDDLILFDTQSRRPWVAPKGASLNFGPPWVEFRTLNQGAPVWRTPVFASGRIW